MTEWRSIPDFPGYRVSDDGRVFSEKRGRLLSTFIDASGYRRLGLHAGGKRVNVRVHVLVATAFLGQRPDGSVIRHLYGNHLNNRPTNLTYGTQSENVRDSVDHRTQRNARKTHCIHGHAFTPENVRIEPTAAGGIARKCRACHADRERARRANLKESV